MCIGTRTNKLLRDGFALIPNITPRYCNANRKPAAKKEEEEPPAVKDQDQESDDESDEDEKDREDVDVRDIRYKIETLVSLGLVLYCLLVEHSCRCLRPSFALYIVSRRDVLR